MLFSKEYNISHIWGIPLGFCFALYLVEFGFFNTTFTGIERGEPYAVDVGTISGRRSNFVIVTISLQRITAGRIIYIKQLVIWVFC